MSVSNNFYPSYKMETIFKQINIKNRTYYFYNVMINIQYFDLDFLKLDKKSLKNISIYYIGYIIKTDEYKINSVNPLYLLVGEIDGFIEEKQGNKYLNIAFTDSNSEVLKKHAEIWSGVKDQIKKINNEKLGGYGKDYMKIKFNSDDDLSLSKQLKLNMLTIIIRIVFEENGKCNPQIYLND